MGLMTAWEKWSKNQYDKWGSKLQKKYDDYRDMQTPGWYKQLTDSIWSKLDGSAKNFLNKFVMEICERFDEKFAKELLEKIVERFKKRLA